MGCRVGGLQGAARKKLSGYGRGNRTSNGPGAGESVMARGDERERPRMWVVVRWGAGVGGSTRQAQRHIERHWPPVAQTGLSAGRPLGQICSPQTISKSCW